MRWILAALVAGVAALPAIAAEEAAVLRQRAEQLAAADRCEEALPRAQRARELDPRDARAVLIEGRCLLRLGKYREALAPLGAARELDPKLPGISADLAQAHYHLDEIDAASAELDRAERENPNDARTQLYRGLVLSRQAKQQDAAVAFDRASALDPGLSGVAGLYAGRSWASAQEREKARAALERARAADPDSEWGRTAQRELEVLDAPYQRHVWAKLRAGVEHDSNVTLQNDDLPFSTSQVSDFPDLRHADEQEDTRAVFEAEAGLEFLRDEEQSAGGAVGYNGNAHDNVHQLDLQYPWLTFWYERRLSEDTSLRLQPFGGYAWLETDPFVIHGGATASLLHRFTDRISGQLYSRVNVNDFLYRIRPDPVIEVVAGIPVSEQVRRFRNRDGVESETGIEGRFSLVPGSTSLRAGTAYQRYWAEGRDWDRDGSRSWLGVTQALPLRFLLDVSGSFTYYAYDHRSSYDDRFFDPGRYLDGGGPKRRDRIWDAQAELSYPLTSWLEISARGQYTESESNTEVFDYDRWIAGGYLTVSWGHTL